jgi:acetyl esterase/lipase
MILTLDPDRAYQNGAFIAGADGFPPRWQAQAQAFRAGLGARAELDLTYGPGQRHRFDLFLPDHGPQGLMVFVHGGYWLKFSRDGWSHLAAGALARGWACAMPSYTLAPEVSISQMTQLVAQAVQTASARVPGPVVVTGHSAGGHLSARMGCADLALAEVRRVVPISPLSELDPLRQTGMNADLHLNADEAATESPARLALRSGCSAHVWVGGIERPAFLWQARTLSEAWNCPWTVAPGKHHFDVIDDLTDPTSALMNACLDRISPAP